MSKKLEELNFVPSGKVWDNIERELKKDKHPRFAAWWWIFPLLILLGWGVYRLTMADPKHQQQSKTAKSSQANSGTTDESTSIVSPESNTMVKNQENPASPAAPSSLIDVPPSNAVTKKSSEGNTKNRLVFAQSFSKNEKFKGSAHKKSRALIDKATSSITVNAPAFSEEPETKEVAPAPTSVEQDAKTGEPNSLLPLAKATEDKKESQDTFPPYKQLKKASTKGSSPKWQIGLMANAGIASINKMGVFKENEPSIFYSNTANPGTVTPGRIVSNSYKINNGASLSVGFVAVKALSQKFQIGSGLLYNNTRIAVRRKQKTDSIFSTSTGFISNTTRMDLFNENLQLHSFDIPLSAGFSMFNSKKIQLNLNTIVINRFLVSGNWKDYETVLGKKKTYMPLLQLIPTVSFSKCKQFSIGPYAAFGLSKMQDSKRLMNAGLSLQYLIKK